MAKAREIPELTGTLSFRQAAALTVETRTAEVFEQSENVFDTGDIERVHDMRVATRRLRAAMEIFAPCFPKKEFRQALRDVKRLADALGERRDPDVHIAELERVAAALTRDDAAGIRSLEDELRAEQLAGNESLRATLRDVEETDLRGRLEALVTAARTAA